MTEIKASGLFDDDAEEFLFASAEQKFGWLAKVDVLAKIVDALLIDFDSSSLDQTFGFAFRGNKIQFHKQCGKFSGRAPRELLRWGFSRGLAVAENALKIFGGSAAGFRTLKDADHFFG